MHDQSTVSAGRAEVTHLDLQLYRVPEAMRILSLRRSTIYELIRSGRLRSAREGGAPADPRLGHRGVRRAAEARGPAVSGDDGRTAGQLATTHAYLTGPQPDRTRPGLSQRRQG